MRIVLDTNVVVAALLRPHGTPARILKGVLQGTIEIAVSEVILDEYREVLWRPKFQLPRNQVEILLHHIRASACHAPSYPEPLRLPDPDDTPFLEAALALASDALVTGNTKHFPPDHCRGMRVVTPAGFLDMWAETRP